jgi:hypothetical protein
MGDVIGDISVSVAWGTSRRGNVAINAIVPLSG